MKFTGTITVSESLINPLSTKKLSLNPLRLNTSISLTERRLYVKLSFGSGSQPSVEEIIVTVGMVFTAFARGLLSTSSFGPSVCRCAVGSGICRGLRLGPGEQFAGGAADEIRGANDGDEEEAEREENQRLDVRTRQLAQLTCKWGATQTLSTCPSGTRKQLSYVHCKPFPRLKIKCEDEPTTA